MKTATIVIALLLAGSASAAILQPEFFLAVVGLEAPDAGSLVNQTIPIQVSAEGHPETIGISATSPVGPTILLDTCYDSTQCSALLTLDQCGIWIVHAVVRYAHEDPNAPGYPYTIAESIAVVVDQCEIFSDGFESGSTGEWSSTNGNS